MNVLDNIAICHLCEKRESSICTEDSRKSKFLSLCKSDYCPLNKFGNIENKSKSDAVLKSNIVPKFSNTTKSSGCGCSRQSLSLSKPVSKTFSLLTATAPNNVVYLCVGGSGTFTFKGNPNSQYVLTCSCTWLEPFAPPLDECTPLSITITTDQNGNYPLTVTVLVNDRCPPHNTPSGCSTVTGTPVGGGQGCSATVCIGCPPVTVSPVPSISVTATIPTLNFTYIQGGWYTGCITAGGEGFTFTFTETSVSVSGTLTYGGSNWAGTLSGTATGSAPYPGGPTTFPVSTACSVTCECNTCYPSAQWQIEIANSTNDQMAWTCKTYNGAGGYSCGPVSGYWATSSGASTEITSTGLPNFSNIALTPVIYGYIGCLPQPSPPDCGGPGNCTISIVSS